MRKVPTYQKDEFGFNLAFTIRERSDDGVFVLTGYTLKFYMWLPNATAPKINAGVVNIVDGASGTCVYPVAAGDFDTIGSYNWEIKLTKAGVERSAKGAPNIVIKEEHP